MSEQERPLIDRVWEFTKDISVKVSRKAEKHWKINTLRVEIASIRHRINVKYKELGRYVYESVKSQTLEEDSYKASLREFFDELKRLEGEILQRENRIEILEQEMNEAPEQKQQPPPFPGESAQETVDDEAEVVEAEVVEAEQIEDSTESDEGSKDGQETSEAEEAKDDPEPTDSGSSEISPEGDKSTGDEPTGKDDSGDTEAAAQDTESDKTGPSKGEESTSN